MLAFPLARVTTDEHEREGALEPRLYLGVGADQQWQSLDSREAAEVEEDRLGGEGGEILLTVGDRSGPALLVPSLRILDQPATPETAARIAAEWRRLEVLEVDTAGKTVQPPARQGEQLCDFGFGAGRHDQPLAAARPAAKPLLPGARIPPARRRRLARKGAQEGELRAVQLPDDRQRGEVPERRLVSGGEVVQMKEVGLAGACFGERHRPGSHKSLVGHVVDRGEDTVRADRTVLVRRLERDTRGERIRELERRRIVDDRKVDAGVEARRIGRGTWGAERAGRERHLPAGRRQRARERTRDLRRAAARKEEQRRADATPRPQWLRRGESRATRLVSRLPHPRILLDQGSAGRRV